MKAIKWIMLMAMLTLCGWNTALADGYDVTDDLWIKAVINTEEKGPIDAIWAKGGEKITASGHKVIWGYFYASPDNVNWGSANNPDLYVKIWFDNSGRIDVNFFHVSVPDIEVYSTYTDSPLKHNTATVDDRYFRHVFGTDEDYVTASTPLTAASKSFAPVSARNCYGDLIALQWTYSIDPVSVYTEVGKLNLSFSDVQMSVNTSDLLLKVNFSGTISGVATGNVDYNVISVLTDDSSSMFISSEDIDIDMNMVVEGYKVNISIGLDVMFSPAADWFINRKDLDSLDIGYVYDERGDISATVNGWVEYYIQGYGSDSTNIDNVRATSSERWEIKNKLDSMVVNGVTYNNIVEVERTTVVPDASGQTHSGYKETTITYYVAKGIGWIQAKGLYNIYGEDLEIRLKKTNLEQW